MPYSRVAFVAADAEPAREALAALTRRYGQNKPEDADVIVALGGDGLAVEPSTKPNDHGYTAGARQLQQARQRQHRPTHRLPELGQRPEPQARVQPREGRRVDELTWGLRDLFWRPADQPAEVEITEIHADAPSRRPQSRSCHTR